MSTLVAVVIAVGLHLSATVFVGMVVVCVSCAGPMRAVGTGRMCMGLPDTGDGLG
jgi:hypothetical protein